MHGDDPPGQRTGGASWREPFHWWGPPWHEPTPMSIAELIDLGTLTEAQANWLSEHLDRGGSLIVAASAQGAGKSTLAHALADELPGERTRVYLRGMYEPFDWVEGTEPAATTILVNEISPHLPVYAWGETVRRLLALGEVGYQIIATLHADTPAELIAQLSAYPIQATAAQLAALDVVVFITVAVEDDTNRRRAKSIVSLALDRQSGGLVVHPVPL